MVSVLNIFALGIVNTLAVDSRLGVDIRTGIASVRVVVCFLGKLAVLPAGGMITLLVIRCTTQRRIEALCTIHRDELRECSVGHLAVTDLTSSLRKVANIVLVFSTILVATVGSRRSTIVCINFLTLRRFAVPVTTVRVVASFFTTHFFTDRPALVKRVVHTAILGAAVIFNAVNR